MIPVKLLVVDDNDIDREFMCQLVRGGSYSRIDSAANAAQAVELFKKEKHTIVLTDWSLTGEIQGDRLVDMIKTEAKAYQHFVYIIMVTGVNTAALERALDKGADEFVTKQNLAAELLPRIRAGLRIVNQVQQLRSLTKVVQRLSRSSKLVLDSQRVPSPKMAKALEMMAKVAPHATTVLILGERGTGKEEAALTIHQMSGRPPDKFFAVNCAAFNENLIESELFGHEKGAFTGADRQRIGMFEQAHGGTLFLDEVGELSPTAQAKLLRVLQERRFERVGGMETVEVDVRVIAATNADLEKHVNTGKFRPDLRDRLNVYEIRLPRLAERGDDVLVLAKSFLKERLPDGQLTPEAEKFLRDYDWPGNVRELSNFIERAVINAVDGRIRPEHFGEPHRSAHPTASPPPAGELPSQDALIAGYQLDLRRLGRGEINLDQLGQATVARVTLWINANLDDRAQKARACGLSLTKYTRRLTAANELHENNGLPGLPPPSDAG